VTSNTEPGSTDETQQPSSSTEPKNKAKPFLIGVSIVAAVALAASVWFGIGWKDAAADRATAETRDSALTGAQQAVLNMTTLDSANLDQSFDTILTSVTGDDMNKFIEDMRSSFTEDQRDLTAKTTSEVLSGTLTEFSEDEGTARALVVVATTTTRDGYQPSRQRLVMELGMQDVDGTWKASQATPIGDPVPLNPVAGTVDPNAAADPNATADPNTDPNTDPNATVAPTDPGATEGAAPGTPSGP
jgi:Mce-associated membrane protein